MKPNKSVLRNIITGHGNGHVSYPVICGGQDHTNIPFPGQGRGVGFAVLNSVNDRKVVEFNDTCHEVITQSAHEPLDHHNVDGIYVVVVHIHGGRPDPVQEIDHPGKKSLVATRTDNRHVDGVNDMPRILTRGKDGTSNDLPQINNRQDSAYTCHVDASSTSLESIEDVQHTNQACWCVGSLDAGHLSVVSQNECCREPVIEGTCRNDTCCRYTVVIVSVKQENQLRHHRGDVTINIVYNGGHVQ